MTEHFAPQMASDGGGAASLLFFDLYPEVLAMVLMIRGSRIMCCTKMISHNAGHNGIVCRRRNQRSYESTFIRIKLFESDFLAECSQISLQRCLQYPMFPAQCLKVNDDRITCEVSIKELALRILQIVLEHALIAAAARGKSVLDKLTEGFHTMSRTTYTPQIQAVLKRAIRTSALETWIDCSRGISTSWRLQKRFLIEVL